MVVAGRFYPGAAAALTKLLDEYLKEPPADLKSPLAVFAPHAGYLYSGKIAGDIYKSILVPNTVIVLCPNHTGGGPRIALWGKGSWKTPLGPVPIDEDFASELLKNEGKILLDQSAHAHEHAIEVHLPFLLKRNPKVKIVPITLGRLRFDDIEWLGNALAKTIQKHWEKALVVASTDMSHYLPAKEAEKKDAPALQKIEALDAKGLYQVVVENQISMCGYLPTATALVAAKTLGAKACEVVTYGNSGMTSGNYESVVAYASGWIG